MSKTKIVEKIVRFELFLTVIGQLCKSDHYRKTFQNKIFPELNSKKHTPSPFVWVLRNCWIAQNLSFAKAEKGNFARNDFCEWLRKLLFFRAKLMRKERKILRFVPQNLRKSFANGNPSIDSRRNDVFFLHCFVYKAFLAVQVLA